MKKSVSVIVMLLIVLLVFSACAGQSANVGTAGEASASAAPSSDASASAAPAAEASAVGEGNPIKIVFLQTHNNNSFMAYLGETLVATAAKYGVECDHITADGDEATQLSQIEQAISGGEYAGIIVECAGEGVINGFKEAHDAGIPIMTLHEGVTDNTYVDCVVQCSLAATGNMAINLEAEELGEKFNLAIFDGSEGHGATVAIHEGYEQALAAHPDINVVFEGAGNWNAEDAMALAETWFASGKQIDGVVCMNDGMATGVRQVMKDNGVLGKIPIYSNDCEENTLVAIEAGEQSGSFDMNAEAQCVAAIESMLKLIKGEKLEQTLIAVDPLLVTKENLAEYRASHAGGY